MSETVWVLSLGGGPVGVFWEEAEALKAQEELFLDIQKICGVEAVRPTLTECAIR